MGGEGLRRIAEVPGRYKIRLLVRPSKTNHKKLAPYLDREDVTVVWGDLLNADDVKRAMGDADTVLHVGGMVSPKADHYPERTMHVNVTAARNVVDAVKARKDADEVRVVYIGSVAQISCHDEPYHWGRSGDPLVASEFDNLLGVAAPVGHPPSRPPFQGKRPDHFPCAPARCARMGHYGGLRPPSRGALPR